MTQVNHIPTVKTARYYTIGNFSKNTKNIWLVLHGYGMRAEEFIKPFENITSEHDVVIAPEALSRFYTKGLMGPVGASWMTKEDREKDITDNLAYLKTVYDATILPHVSNARIYLLGFSQGASTLARFVAYIQPVFHRLWICAGDIPDDIDWENFKKLTEGNKLHIQIGKKDPLIQETHLDILQNRLKKKEISYVWHQFEGIHEVSFEILKSTLD